MQRVSRFLDIHDAQMEVHTTSLINPKALRTKVNLNKVLFYQKKENLVDHFVLIHCNPAVWLDRGITISKENSK